MKFKIVILTALILSFSFGVFAQKAKSSKEPLEVGAIAPDFTLSSNKDKQVTLSKVDQLTLLVFYRGYW